MLMRIIFILSSIPLAVGFSYDPQSQEVLIKSNFRDESRLNTAQPETLTESIDDKVASLSEALARSGVEYEYAQAMAYRSVCLSESGPLLPRWAGGQRYSGSLWIPDSASIICGYSTTTKWKFRADMEGPQQIACAAQLIRGPFRDGLDRAHKELISQFQTLNHCLDNNRSSRLATANQSEVKL